MIGENLREIKQINDEKIMIRTTENIYFLEPYGEWDYEAWVHSIPEKVYKGIIRKINDNGYHYTIITDGGYNDIELRVEYGYEGSFNLFMQNSPTL